ncbi:MAG: T9SS type A sorting domain-containing protein, partial [Ignavibacteriales bacterium]|nr:T9SS type A sorting domain-containing protein [Ignavibacteriales bacterium]
TGGGTISNTYNSWPTGNQGTEWVLKNSKSWTSTNSNGGGPYSTILQAPYHQVATAGVYDWAISVQPLSGGRSEVRWYFVQQHAASSTNYYWWGGTFVDSTSVTTKFNAIGFGCNNDLDATTKQVNIRNVKVDLGTPITVPAAPWQSYYVSQWGFIGGRMYGWNFTQGDVNGNATISGTKPNDKWAAIRGGFETVTPTTAKALVLTGKVEFVGGGLYAPGTFRFGTFYSNAAGKVILDSAKATLPDSTRWDGLETYTSGYLFTPPVGSTGLFNWTGVNQTASAGGVVNGAWLHTDYPGTGGLTNNYKLGTDVQTPANAAFAAGVYDFTITVAAKSTTSNDVRWKLSKGTSYSITGKLTDTHAPLAATKFNSINFAVSGDALATGLKLTDVKVDYLDVASVPIASVVGVTSVEGAGSAVPTVFALDQNYPNPFNPSTTIRYDVAKPANVTIRVYDVLGRMVAQLVDGVHAASSYVVQWNPSGLSSGTYLYRIDARNVDGSGTFSSVKKLILMK